MENTEKLTDDLKFMIERFGFKEMQLALLTTVEDILFSSDIDQTVKDQIQIIISMHRMLVK